jgi:hypothetical protein
LSHRKRHQKSLVPQASPPPAENVERELLGEATAEEADADAHGRELLDGSYPQEATVPRALLEDAQATVEAHGRELRAAVAEAAAALQAKLDAALDHEQRKAALVPLIQQQLHSLRAELAAAKRAAEEAKRGEAAAVAELEALRQSADAAAQATAEAHGRELRAVVAEAEGKTAAAVAEAKETTRQSTFAGVHAIAEAL